MKSYSEKSEVARADYLEILELMIINDYINVPLFLQVKMLTAVNL